MNSAFLFKNRISLNFWLLSSALKNLAIVRKNIALPNQGAAVPSARMPMVMQ